MHLIGLRKLELQSGKIARVAFQQGAAGKPWPVQCAGSQHLKNCPAPSTQISFVAEEVVLTSSGGTKRPTREWGPPKFSNHYTRGQGYGMHPKLIRWLSFGMH